MSVSASSNPSPYDESYLQYQVRPRSWLRLIMREWYLSAVIRHIDGPALDFGCGAGDLLCRLPQGSLGVDINPVAVQYCLKRGLRARLYDAAADGYSFEFCAAGEFSAIVISHVLEHMEDPATVLKKMFPRLASLGINKIIVIVPCKKGFDFDKTHRTFVSEAYLREHGLWETKQYRVQKNYFFPVNLQWPQRFYTYHELHVIFGRA
jgi:SAM-dependent methyltransferase